MNDALRPDRTEEELGLGIGGSAGSIEALQNFFGTMPAGSGLAFVVVTHLAQEHESMLADILQRSTRMPVHRAEDGMRIEPGHAYVIPSGKLLECSDGKLRLQDP